MGFLPMEIWPVEDIKRDITLAAKVMYTHVGCLLGGEPTSHPKLVELMRFTAESGLCERVQVLTNGMRLHRMKEDFWRELDWLKVSVYPGKTQPENIDLAHRMQAKHGFQLEFYDVAADPFRAVLTDRERSPQSAQQTYEGCWYRTYTRKIEQGYFYRCCTSPSISRMLGNPPDVDAVKLDGLTPEALTEFLARPDYMQSCTRCYGNLGPRLEQWSEQRDKDRWLEESMVALPMVPA